MDCLSNILKHDTLTCQKGYKKEPHSLFILALTYKFVTSLETVQINNKRAACKTSTPSIQNLLSFLVAERI